MFGRVDPFEAVDAMLRSLRQEMLECELLPEMKSLLWRRDQMLERRHSHACPYCVASPASGAR